MCPERLSILADSVEGRFILEQIGQKLDWTKPIAPRPIVVNFRAREWKVISWTRPPGEIIIELLEPPAADPELLAPRGPDRRESVNHPIHYGGDVPHEVWKCLNAWGLENDALLWNAVKYIGRAGKKNDLLEDLKKARWYLNKRIELLEAKNENPGAVREEHSS